MFDIRRREFITLLGGAVAAWPLTARAQHPAMPVVGFLGTSSLEKSGGGSLLAFKRGLAETSYVEDRNVRSSIAGRMTSMIDCQPWRWNWLDVGWRYSLRLAARRRCRPRRRRLSSRSFL